MTTERSTFDLRSSKWLVLVFLLSLPAVTTRLYASDEIQFFSWLRSWAFDRDIDFENEYRYFHDTGVARNPSFAATFLERTNEAGRRINFTPIGCAILWAPFYAAGHVAALVTGAPANGLSAPYVAAVSYASACYGFLAVLLSAAIARHVIGQGLLAAVVVWIGTPLVYYMYVTPPFSHACSAFAVSLFLYTWLRVRDTWSLKGVALLGVLGALMAMVREQDVFFVVGPAVDFIRHWSTRPGRSALGARRSNAQEPSARSQEPTRLVVVALVGALSFLLAYSPQLLAYTALNGHAGPTELVGRKMNWAAPHAWSVLFSPEHGLFAWTPLALPAVVGLVVLAVGRLRKASASLAAGQSAESGRAASVRTDAAWLGRVALVMFAAQIYITGAVESWTLAGSFGQRRFVALTPLLTLGLAVVFAGVTRRATDVARDGSRRLTARAAVAAIVILAVWWNVGLMAQFGLNQMDRQRLTLRDNTWNTFIVLPRALPSIVIRYLTDRSSFYGQPRQ